MSPLIPLDHSWLVWVESSLLDVSHLHVQKAVRYVPSNPESSSPAFPSISPSPHPIDRDIWLRYVSPYPPLPRGSHYSLESTSLAIAALNFGTSMKSLDLDLELDLPFPLFFVTLLVLQIMNQ
jgi:hypothetical protein